MVPEEKTVIVPEVAPVIVEAKVEEKVEEVVVVEPEVPKENGITETQVEPKTVEAVSEEKVEEPVDEKPASPVIPETPTPETKSPEPVEGETTATPEPTGEVDPNADPNAEPTGDDNALPEFQNLAIENRARIDAGEKVAYGREFLLKFQSACLDKPKELPNLDVILDGPTDGHRKPPVHERSNRNDFSPHFMQRGKGGNSKGASKGGRRPSGNPSAMMIKLPSSKPVSSSFKIRDLSKLS